MTKIREQDISELTKGGRLRVIFTALKFHASALLRLLWLGFCVVVE